MVKNKAIFTFLIASIAFASCQKDKFIRNSDNTNTNTETPVITPGEEPAVTPEPVVPVTPITPSVPAPASSYAVPADAKVIELGTGSGNLVIDGASLNIQSNSFIKVKGGNYGSITIKNILASTSKPVYIKNIGQVNTSQRMIIDNVSNVVLAGDNTAGITYGFAFSNISYRAISVSGKMDGLVLKNLSFKNIGDYAIAGEKNLGTEMPYDGTENTRVDGFKILNSLFENAGTIWFGGNLNKDNNEDSGFFKDVEIAYNTFQNSPTTGSVCTFTNVQDYNIHHNVVNNINSNQDNHNGVFLMQGNGDFHDNKLTNYQGNAIRMWVYSRGSTPATNKIYNNSCYNTRKYGGFELQGFPRNIWAGKSTYGNASVYNNTVGKMNTSKDWDGQVLDLYNFNGGSLEYYNNLGYDLFNQKGAVTDMINNMSDVKITVKNNNKYVATQQSAVSDLVNFRSIIAGVGALLN